MEKIGFYVTFQGEGDYMNSCKITRAGLVLEGGGMRGLYTTGVLDFFLDRELYFDYVIGVSAGASHALSYITRQKGRARRVNVDYCTRSDYMGLGCLFAEGSLFGMRLLFEKIPFRYDLFDFEAFERNVGRYYAVVTNMLTGQAEYLAPRKASEVLPAARASCSLPLVSPPVVIQGIPYLDGGVADSIPVSRALEDGNGKLVVVLTQPAGYRKGPNEFAGLNRFVYRKYPELLKTLGERNERYNRELDLVDRLEEEGRALVIRPRPQEGLERLERRPSVLNALYESGYADAARLEAALREFCS